MREVHAVALYGDVVAVGPVAQLLVGRLVGRNRGHWVMCRGIACGGG